MEFVIYSKEEKRFVKEEPIPLREVTEDGYTELEKKAKSDDSVVEYESYNDKYLLQQLMQRKDFTSKVPPKTLERWPKAWMGHDVWGLTVLGWGWMVVRDDLNPEKSYETQVHEAIHTPDEYETRVITRWMLDTEDESRKY